MSYPTARPDPRDCDPAGQGLDLDSTKFPVASRGAGCCLWCFSVLLAKGGEGCFFAQPGTVTLPGGWLLGCLVAWLLGCLVAWLLGCLVAWLLGCLVGRLVGDEGLGSG